jgi:hypothetical protein
MLPASSGFEGRLDPPTGDSASSLGIILGVIFGLLVIVAIIVLGVIYWHTHNERTQVQEPEVDPVAQFFDDNRREMQAEYEMAFENPVFNRNATGEIASGDEFESGFDEGEVL